jgi:hypothetical protein
MKTNLTKSARLLCLSLAAYKRGEFKTAGKLLSESADLDAEGSLEQALKEVSLGLPDLESGMSTSYDEKSLPLGDKRNRFKRDLDDDYEDEVDSLEDFIPKNSEQQIQLLLDSEQNPSLSEAEKTDKDFEDIEDSEVVDELEWEDPTTLAPSISRESKVVKITI